MDRHAADNVNLPGVGEERETVKNLQEARPASPSAAVEPRRSCQPAPAPEENEEDLFREEHEAEVGREFVGEAGGYEDDSEGQADGGKADPLPGHGHHHARPAGAPAPG
eukprot:tig00020603_g11768.t1